MSTNFDTFLVASPPSCCDTERGAERATEGEEEKIPLCDNKERPGYEGCKGYEEMRIYIFKKMMRNSSNCGFNINLSIYC
jgi:hypothetical protein